MGNEQVDKFVDAAVRGAAIGGGFESIRSGKSEWLAFGGWADRRMGSWAPQTHIGAGESFDGIVDGVVSGAVLGLVWRGAVVLADKVGVKEHIEKARDNLRKN